MEQFEGSHNKEIIQKSIETITHEVLTNNSKIISKTGGLCISKVDSASIHALVATFDVTDH